MDNSIHFEKLKQYSAALDNLARNNSTDVFPNRDSQHAAIAIAKILKYSKHDVVIFDDDLKGDIVNNDKIESFRSSVIDFISRKGNLKIIISDREEDDEGLQLFLKTLKKLYSEQVSIKLASPDFKKAMKEVYNEKINFVLGDTNKYRLECFGNNKIADKTRQATGSFNNEKVVKELMSVFNSKYKTCIDYYPEITQ